jgi:DNA/RNA endonuclease YhcR with UshA esterase domain
VAHREQMDAAFGGNIAGALTGARVQISGTVTSYRDRPQMIISEPEQIRLIAPSTRPTTRPAQ